MNFTKFALIIILVIMVIFAIWFWGYNFGYEYALKSYCKYFGGEYEYISSKSPLRDNLRVGNICVLDDGEIFEIYFVSFSTGLR